MKSRGKNGDGHDACVYATPKCGDKIEAAPRVEKKSPFICCGKRRKRGSNGACAQIQLRVGEAGVFDFPIGKIAEGNARVVLRRLGAEHFNQISIACVLTR